MYLGRFLLILAGVLAAVVALCFLARLAERKMATDEYDERQKIARGNAYRLSFWVNVMYNFVILCWHIVQMETEHRGVEVYVVVFAGLLLSLIVFHTYCAITVSAFSNAKTANPWISAIGYGFMCFVNISYFARSWTPGLPLPNTMGPESAWWLQLLSGVCFGYLSLVTLIQAVLLRVLRNRE